MGMKITVKVVFDSSKEGLESFGNSRYLLKLPYPEDSGALAIVTTYISRKIGIPPSKVAFQGKDVRGNWTFELL